MTTKKLWKIEAAIMKNIHRVMPTRGWWKSYICHTEIDLMKAITYFDLSSDIYLPFWWKMKWICRLSLHLSPLLTHLSGFIQYIFAHSHLPASEVSIRIVQRVNHKNCYSLWQTTYVVHTHCTRQQRLYWQHPYIFLQKDTSVQGKY